MAEIELKFNGDSSSAQASVQSLADSVDKLAHAVEGLKDKEKEHGEEQAKSIEKWRLIGEAAKKTIEVLYEFGKDSAKEFLASEQAARRLAFAVGKDLGKAFRDTAEEMEKSFGVQAESVMALQQKLAQFSKELTKGDIDKITKSMLDYSAATGEDAVQATEKLLMATQKGRTAFKDLGITYDLVGEKSKDLLSASTALGNKFGGASESEANSMTGQLARAAREFENFKKAFGEMIVLVGEKTQIVQGFTIAMGYLAEKMHEIIGPKDELEKQQLKLKEIGSQLVDLINLRDKAMKNGGEFEHYTTEEYQHAIDVKSKELDQVKAYLAKETPKLSRDGAGVAGDDMTTHAIEAKKTSDKKAYEDALKERQRRLKEQEDAAKKAAAHTQDLAESAYKEEHQLDKKWASAKITLDKETQDRLGKQAEKEYARESKRLEAFLADSKMSEEDKDAERLKLSMEYSNRHLELIEEETRAELSAEAKKHELILAEQRKADAKRLAEQKKSMHQMEQLMHEVGNAIGSGLGKAIGAGITGSSEYMEADLFETIGKALISAVSAVVAAIPGAGMFLSPLISGVGNTGISAIAGQMRAAADRGRQAEASANMQSSINGNGGWQGSVTYHNGGWIGAPRYHSGSWIGNDEQAAILQTGERVLSRSEVAKMGGPGAVDSGAKGKGGGVQVYINAIDTQGVKRFFEDKGGDGFRRAISSGRGDIARLFGKGKVY